MRYRPFGHTDLRVSELGLGGGRLGATLREGTGRDVTRMLQEALDSGISFYDTADSYGQGKSEELIGGAFRDRRDRVVIATKTGYRLSSAAETAARLKPVLRPLLRSLRPLRRAALRARSSQLSRDFSAGHINGALDASLRRLQTDHVDLYQLHDPPTAVLRDGQVFAVLDGLRSTGKVRYYGVSCRTVEDALLALRYPDVSAVQVKLNLLDRRAIGGLLTATRRRRVAVIARQPLAGGFLTQSEAELDTQAAVMDQNRFQERLLAAGQFRFLASGSRTLTQAAIQFALGQDGVAVVLPGISSVRHLREAVGALTAPPLTDQEWAMIQAI
jgi:aryl-alcohol dehydrogenase-like predicted oxidoreductase